MHTVCHRGNVMEDPGEKIASLLARAVSFLLWVWSSVPIKIFTGLMLTREYILFLEPRIKEVVGY